MGEQPSEAAIVAAYGEAEHVRERFQGHDDSWIIAELWRRLAEARREAGHLRHFQNKVEASLDRLHERQSEDSDG